MIHTLQTWGKDLMHFFFPHICAGCGSDLILPDQTVCIQCHTSIPETGFSVITGNPIEKIFYGRLPVVAATSCYFFTKDTALQNLIHALKYKGRQEVGIQLGRWMGIQLKESARFNTIDLLVPMPLFKDRERKRGYNQAALLCQGIAEITGIPVETNWIGRLKATATQTRKGRNERWENVQDSFRVLDSEKLQGKHILLVDDVITTGATLEACGSCITSIAQTRLSIATLAWASDD
jgi:ComF family protein